MIWLGREDLDFEELIVILNNFWLKVLRSRRCWTQDCKEKKQYLKE